jgi:hypothetical protein
MQTNDPQCVPHFRVVDATPDRLFQARPRFFHFSPVGGAHSPLERTRRRAGRRAGGRIVCRERVVEMMRELKRVSELEPCRRVSLGQELLERSRLHLRGRQLAGEP